MSIAIYLVGAQESYPDTFLASCRKRDRWGCGIPAEWARSSVPASATQASNFRGIGSVNEATNGRTAREQGQRTERRLPARLWLGAGMVIAAAGLAWLAYSYHESDASTPASPNLPPQVVVSKP